MLNGHPGSYWNITWSWKILRLKFQGSIGTVLIMSVLFEGPNMTKGGSTWALCKLGLSKPFSKRVRLLCMWACDWPTIESRSWTLSSLKSLIMKPRRDKEYQMPGPPLYIFKYETLLNINTASWFISACVGATEGGWWESGLLRITVCTAPPPSHLVLPCC